MARLAQTADLTDFQKEILSAVRSFVHKEIIPDALELEHKDEFPEAILCTDRCHPGGPRPGGASGRDFPVATFLAREFPEDT